MFRSRPILCIDCEEITINGTRCHDCETMNEAVRRAKRGKTSERYSKEYQAIRKTLLEHARAEGMICVLQFEGICTERLTSADHIVPISRGGGDDIDNLQPTCSPCNTAKGNQLQRIL